MMANDDASGYMGSMDIGFGGGGKVLSNSGFADITELCPADSPPALSTHPRTVRADHSFPEVVI